MPASVADGGRYNAPGGAASGDLYLGTWGPVSGDTYLTFFKWDDAAATINFSDGAFQTWTKLTARLHSAGGSSLRSQIGYIVNLPTLASNDTYAGPTTSVDNREGVTYLIRGLTSSPIASTDNITYASGTTITLTSVDPGSNGGIVVGFFAWHETGLTVTVPSGWTRGPDIYTTASRTCMIYKVASGAGGLAPSLTFSGSATVMGTSIALSAPASAASTYLTGYLEATAIGKTVTVLAWTGDPSANLATKYTSVPLVSALDPGSAVAAKFVVTPAPGGTTNGQTLLTAVFDPGNSDVSSYGFPSVVTGSSSIIQTLDSPAETLSMQAYIDQMTTSNEIYFQHYPEDPGGVAFDVNGAAQTSNGVPFEFGYFISWGVIGPAPGGNLGPIDKLWIAIRKMHQGDYNGTTLTRQVAEDAPNGSIYDRDLASGAVTAVTRELHPAGVGYGMRIRASECCAVPGRYWHFYGGGAPAPGPSGNYTAYDRMVGGYQIRVEADTLADLAAQLPNLRMAAYAGGDFSSPLAGGPALTQIANGKTRRLDDTWRWMLWGVKKGTTNVDFHPDSSGHISAIAGDLSTLSGATLPTP